MPDGLDSQLDTLEASIISLNTKMAVIDSICEKDVSFFFCNYFSVVLR